MSGDSGVALMLTVTWPLEVRYMKIIDSHTHLGECQIYGGVVTENDLISRMDANKVGVSIVQPFPGELKPERCHDRIAELARQHPGRFFGMVHMNPHLGREVYGREAIRCLRDLKFVALKIHTAGHAVFPNSSIASMVAEVAQDHGVPVMIHTGSGVPFALPSLVIPLAKSFPSVTFILAHAGFAIYTIEAQIVAAECPNVILETSWCLTPDVAWLVGELGAERVMMGSDLPSNLPVELAKYSSIGISASELHECLCGTASRVFFKGHTP